MFILQINPTAGAGGTSATPPNRPIGNWNDFMSQIQGRDQNTGRITVPQTLTQIRSNLVVFTAAHNNPQFMSSLTPAQAEIFYSSRKEHEIHQQFHLFMQQHDQATREMINSMIRLIRDTAR